MGRGRADYDGKIANLTPSSPLRNRPNTFSRYPQRPWRRRGGIYVHTHTRKRERENMTGTFNSVCTCYSLVSYGSAFCRTEAFWLLMGLSCWPLPALSLNVSLSLSLRISLAVHVTAISDPRVIIPRPSRAYKCVRDIRRSVARACTCVYYCIQLYGRVRGGEKAGAGRGKGQQLLRRAQNRSYNIILLCFASGAHKFPVPVVYNIFSGREKRPLRRARTHTHTRAFYLHDQLYICINVVLISRYIIRS